MNKSPSNPVASAARNTVPTQPTPQANNTQPMKLPTPVPVHSIAAIRSTLENPTATSIVDFGTDWSRRQKYYDEYNNFILDWKGPINSELASQLWLTDYVCNEETGSMEWKALYLVEGDVIQARAIKYRLLPETLKFVSTRRKITSPTSVTRTEIKRHVSDCLGPRSRFGWYLDNALEDFIRANTLKLRLYYLFQGQAREVFSIRCPTVPKHWLEVAQVAWNMFGLLDMVIDEQAKLVVDTLSHLDPKRQSNLVNSLDPLNPLTEAVTDFAGFAFNYRDMARLPIINLLLKKADGLKVILAALLSGEQCLKALIAKQDELAKWPVITMQHVNGAVNEWKANKEKKFVFKKPVPKGPAAYMKRQCNNRRNNKRNKRPGSPNGVSKRRRKPLKNTRGLLQTGK